MKTISHAILALIMVCAMNPATAQEKSEKNSFRDFPSSIQITDNQLRSCFDSKEGDLLTFSFTDEFKFSGKVVSNVIKYHNLQSVVIRSSNFENTLFQISKQILEDKSVMFVGRMISAESAEGYRISKDEKGYYSLTKFETAHIVQDCFSHQ